MKPMITTLQKYASFRGIASRKEFWSWVLFSGLIVTALSALTFSTNNTACAYILWAVCALLTIPTLAVTVRRLHDTGHSGWWIILWGLILFGTVVYGFLSGYLLQGMSPGDTVSPFVRVSFPIVSLFAFGYSLLMLFWLAAPGKDPLETDSSIGVE